MQRCRFRLRTGFALCALVDAWLAACGAGSEAPAPRRQSPQMQAPAGAKGGDTLDAAFHNPVHDAGFAPTAPNLCGGRACGDAAVAEPTRIPDDDGFSVAEGDCDDFAPLVNPGAFDVPGNGIDDDCQGGDATQSTCDDSLDLASQDALAAARAIELCPAGGESSKRWGVISARWTTPDGLGKPGSALVHGLLPNFGAAFTPRAGKTLLAMSSGVARAPGQAGFTADCSDEFPASSQGLPKGFDGSSPSCPREARVTEIVDAVALEVRVRIPSNVSALSFDSAFFTDEYPDFICSTYNDFFQVIVEPLRAGGSADGNVVFDLDGNSISVNNSLLRACTAGRHGGKQFECPLGYEPLRATGYDDCSRTVGGIFAGLFGGSNKAYGASTGWVSTEFAVTPGEIITLRFMIWDSADSALDSLAIIDHVRFRLRDKPPPPDKPVTIPRAPD